MQHYQDGELLEQGVYDELNFDDDESLIEETEILTFEINTDPLELLDEIDIEQNEVDQEKQNEDPNMFKDNAPGGNWELEK